MQHCLDSMFQDVQPAKRPRGDTTKISRLPELLVILLDARLCTLELPGAPGQGLFPEVWESLQLFLRAHLLLSQGQKVVVLAAATGTVPLSEICDASEWEAARETARLRAVKLEAKNGGQLAATLSCSLCLIQRQAEAQKMDARVLIIDGSSSEVDYIAESAGLVSAAFAAKSQGTLVDALSVGQCASFLLRQVCILAEGKHVSLSQHYQPTSGQPPLAEVLAPSMLFHFMSTKMVRKELMVAADSQHLPAVCRCHGKPLEIGHVCSSCLSIYCSDASAICSSCGTRFKRNRDPDPKLKDLGEELLELLGASLPDG